MDDRHLNVVCVTEIKGMGKDTTDLPGNRFALSAGVAESERGYQGVGVLLSSWLVNAVMVYKAYKPKTALGSLQAVDNKSILVSGELSEMSASLGEASFGENVREVWG